MDDHLPRSRPQSQLGIFHVETPRSKRPDPKALSMRRKVQSIEKPTGSLRDPMIQPPFASASHNSSAAFIQTQSQIASSNRPFVQAISPRKSQLELVVQYSRKETHQRAMACLKGPNLNCTYRSRSLA